MEVAVDHYPHEEPLSKHVQELVINGDEVPERYICKDSDHGITEASFPLIDIPAIDLSLLMSSSISTTGEQELNKLHSALSSWGFFQAVNHGIASSFLDELREVTKTFFALPMEEKQKYCRAADDEEGYGNDMVHSEQQILDWKDRLYLLVKPQDERKLKYWPENPQTFRELLEEFTLKLQMLTVLVLKAMARSLNLKEDSFLNQYGERAVMLTSCNFYPRCPRSDLVLGFKPHVDGSAITFVLQDIEVEGLQFLKDEQWFKVPIIPHALLIILGDQIEIMSNGIYKSRVHRVLTNSERDRTTVAVFCSPDLENEIGPAEELVSEQSPRLYHKVKNYAANFEKYFQQGKRPIDALKI